MCRRLPLPSVLAVVFVFTCFATQSAHAQTLTVLHTFTGGIDGGYPHLTSMDAVGNLYGNTQDGGTTQPNCGSTGCGLVFKLAQRSPAWVETVLYNFTGGSDGSDPVFGPMFGPAGNLYGSTSMGGNQTCRGGCGILYKLQPPATVCRSIQCSWHETIVHTFTAGSDGATPSSELNFDSAGNFYGTTAQGGILGYGCLGLGCGVVYKFSPSAGGWTETVLYAFTGGLDGGQPRGGVVINSAGDVFGTSDGPTQDGIPGAVYELTPSGSGWIKSFYYDFPVNGANGSQPIGLIIDSAGNLFGGTLMGGSQNAGTVYELSPGGNFTLLYGLPTTLQYGAYGVFAPLTMDAAGNLYGATGNGGQFAMGSVFKLTHSGGSWTYTSLHDFTGGNDGANPGPVLLDANGNVYGSAVDGGTHNYGVVFEITQ